LTAITQPNAVAGGLLWKRAMDLGILFATLPLTVPLLLLTALLIRLDSPGPVVFTQVRTGRHGRPFRMYKYRTMVENAEELKASLAHLNILPSPDFKIPNDPRITRIGKILRKTSLDELPQLINVLRGEMSIVGPRPTSFGVQTYTLWHTERLEVTPGLTGLWQVLARGECTFDERLRLDIDYIDRCSPMLDLQILVMTVLAVVKRSGA
jgi:lipopolysaccharide/colanic/teichoic acid biosynthesis glycosyltransferase